MDESVIRITPSQGEITIIRKKIHGVAINCLIVVYSVPEDWFFKQFPTREAVEEYALEHHLSLKDSENVTLDNES